MNDRNLQSILRRKARLRLIISRRVSEMSDEERSTQSLAIWEAIEQSAVWAAAQTVLFYWPILGEPDLKPFLERAIQSNKTVGLPRYDPESQGYLAAQIADLNADFKDGRYGIREPGPACRILSLIQLDLMLVPGLGFDRRGVRLGRGKGYYDRLCANTKAFKCGVAFERQIVSGDIPEEPHDIRMDSIAAPGEWIRVRHS